MCIHPHAEAHMCALSHSHGGLSYLRTVRVPSPKKLFNY